MSDILHANLIDLAPDLVVPRCLSRLEFLGNEAHILSPVRPAFAPDVPVVRFSHVYLCEVCDSVIEVHADAAGDFLRLEIFPYGTAVKNTRRIG